MNVLVLDDYESISETVSMFFREWGCKAESFTDVFKAYNYFNKYRDSIDLIVTDYQLMREDFNGMDVIRYVKARKDVPCILMTGSMSQELINSLEPIFDVMTDKVKLSTDLEEAYGEILRIKGIKDVKQDQEERKED